VPIVFATYPLLAHIGKAEMIFNVVFFISVSSVLLQGTTLSTVAKWLKVSVPQKAKRRFQLDIEMGDVDNYRDAKSELAEIILPEWSHVVGKEIVDIKFPKNASIVMIRRNKKYFIPGGTTVLEKGDKLLIMADNLETLGAVHQTLEGE